MLEGSWTSTQFQLQAFDISTFSATAASPIAIYNPTYRASYQIEGPTGFRLTRRGADGLAFRSTGGFVSLRTSKTLMPVTTVSLPFATLEGGTGFSGVDVVRWG